MRRRTPPSLASACAVQAERERFAQLLFDPSEEDAERIGHLHHTCCPMPTPAHKGRAILAGVAYLMGLKPVGEVH